HARVLADQHGGSVRILEMAARLQVMCQGHTGRIAEAHDELWGDGGCADAAAYAVGAEILATHRVSPAMSVLSSADSTAKASFVAATSCTRRMCAPARAASTAATMLAGMRSPTSRPEICPSMDLRDTPTSSGRLKWAKRGKALN